MEKPPLPATPAFDEPPKAYGDGPYKVATLEYLNSTTAHGLPSVVSGKRTIQKIIWFLVFWALMGYAGYQLYGIVLEYHDYRVTVKTLKVHRTVAEFPAVTICNENKLRKTKIAGTPYEKIKSLQQKYSTAVFGPGVSSTGSSQPNSNVVASAKTNATGSASPNASVVASAITNATGSATPNASVVASAVTNVTNTIVPAPAPNNPNPPTLGRKKRQLPNSPTSNHQPPTFGGQTLQVPEGDQSAVNVIYMGLSGEHDYEKIFENSMTTDFSDVISMLRPSTEDLDKYGHKMEDFILQCTFDGENCTDSDFTRVYNDVYGNCFTFNYQATDYNPKYTTKFGSQYGLKLSLNIERDEYLGLFSHQYGARITVHAGNVTAFPQDNSVTIPIGKVASVAVDTEVTDIRETPYETNCTTGVGSSLFYPGLYTTDNCLNSCLRTMVKEKCGCVETVRVLQNESRCLISNNTEILCRVDVYSSFRNNEFECQHQCNEPCQEVQYKTSVSYADWPSDGFDALVGKQLVGKMPQNEIKPYIMKNIMRVKVFFSSLRYSHQAATPTYTWETLLSNIGGTWGLFVGFSVCTFLEAFEYLLELLWISCGIACRKPKDKVSPGSFNYAKA